MIEIFIIRFRLLGRKGQKEKKKKKQKKQEDMYQFAGRSNNTD